MISFSEIETTVKRATRSVGFSWGIAEEVGKSVRLSELFGFPGIKHLNQYYQNKKEEKFNYIKLIDKINRSNELSFCPIIINKTTRNGTLFIVINCQREKLNLLKNCACVCYCGIAELSFCPISSVIYIATQ